MEEEHKLLLILALIIGILFFGIPTLTFAHPGRTDSSGCHTCRTNCPSWGLSYGEYHCHRSKGVVQPEEPIRSHYDPSGGYTEPAPDYKTPATNNNSYTAQASNNKSGSNGSIYWIIGIIIIGGIWYIYSKKRKK
jgi:hypothetical protein